MSKRPHPTVEQANDWRLEIVNKLARYLTEEQVTLLRRSKVSAWSDVLMSTGQLVDSPVNLFGFTAEYAALPIPAGLGRKKTDRYRYWCDAARAIPGAWVDIEEWRLRDV